MVKTLVKTKSRASPEQNALRSSQVGLPGACIIPSDHRGVFIHSCDDNCAAKKRAIKQKCRNGICM